MLVSMGDLSLRLGLGLGLESESQRFYKRLRLESESCLEDSDSSPSLAEIVESEALYLVDLPSQNLFFLGQEY